MESPYKGKTGFKRILNAFGYSFSGLSEAFKNEDAFRQEVFLATLLIPLTFWLEHDPLRQALMIACVFLILIVELINSAIEATVDRISLDNHRLAKRAKDIGSASVLIGFINLFVVWTLIIFR
jgi:diacylglycerol kinase (ATP)